MHLAICRDSGRTTAYCTFLSDDVFMRSDREPSAGFSLHLADIAIPELCAACKETGSVPAEALQVRQHSASNFHKLMTMLLAVHL